MSEVDVWRLVFLIGLWTGLAGLITAIGRNDRKPWPMGIAKTFAAWLFVFLSMPVLLAIDWFTPLFRAFGGWAPLLLSGLLSPIVWRVGHVVPIVGPWIAILKRRQTERYQRGIL